MAKLLTGTRIYGTGTVDTQLFVSGTTQATSTITGALQVAGGVGIGGDLYVGGVLYNNGTAVGTTIVDNTSTNATYYPVMSSTNAGTLTTASVSSTKLTFNPSTGQLTAVALISSSDRNLKENITTIDNAMEIIQQLRGVGFSWKENGKKSYGVIAQELETILPELVGTDGNNFKSVSYLPLIGFLIEAIKQQQVEISNIKQDLKNK